MIDTVMVNPLTLIALAAYLATVVRLLTYRKQGARHRSPISLLAWVVLVTIGGSAIELMLNHRAVDIFDAGRAVLIAVFVFGVNGNIAGLLRSE